MEKIVCLPLLTVAQFSEKNPAWTAAALRNLIFRAETNGMKNAGAVIRLGRRVLISEPRFFEWVLKNTEDFSADL